MARAASWIWLILIHHQYRPTQQGERRRPVQPPLSPIPSDPEPGFFSNAFEALPLALLVTVPIAAAVSEAAARATVIKNAAYRQAFGGVEEADADAFFIGCV